MAVNQSVTGLLDSVLQNQMILKNKMEKAVHAIKKICPGPGPPGPPGPVGPKGSCNIAAFPGCQDQCWCEGEPIRWMHTDCSEYPSIKLAPDGRSIILKGDACYTVNFSINLRAPCNEKKTVVVGVQALDSKGISNRFVYYAPFVRADNIFTASAGGIFISTCDYGCTELRLTLFSPDCIEVRQSGISVIEVS